MAKIVDLQLNSSSYYTIPTFNGVGDTNAFRTGLGPGAPSYLPITTQVQAGTITLTGNGNRVIPALSISDSLVDSPGLGSVAAPVAELWFSGDPLNAGAVLDAWSMRCIVDTPAPDTGGFSHFVWGKVVGGSEWFFRNVSTSYGYGAAMQIPGGGLTAGWATGPYRVEVQYDAAQTPACIVRLYANDAAANPNYVLTATLANAFRVNALRFGDGGYSNGTSTWRVGEIEVWNTANADGLFTSNWTTAQSTTYQGARRSGNYTIPAQFTTPSDIVSWSSTGSFRAVDTQDGAAVNASLPYGDKNRVVDLWIPAGSSSRTNGAFPLVMWAHSGFFVSGNKADLPAAFRNRLLNAGYAVASVRYIRSSRTSTTYQAWGTSDGGSANTEGYGRYPSWILDFKLCAARLRSVHSQNFGTSPKLNVAGKGFDGDRIIACGYSVGGYIALAAALTRDLTNDGTGTARNLTLAGNSTYNRDETNTAWTGSDPTFIGALGIAPLNSMQTAIDQDWSHPYTGATRWAPVYQDNLTQFPGTGGFVHVASRGFMGLTSNGANGDVTNTSLANLLTQNFNQSAARVSGVRVAWQRCDADKLISATHQSDFAAAVSGKLSSYTLLTSPANHDNAMLVYDWAATNNWLNSTVVAADGVTSSWRPYSIVI